MRKPWLGWGMLCALGAAAQPEPSLPAAARIILERNCAACHGAAKMSGLDLRTRSSMLAGGKRGPAIVAGRPEESLLLRAVIRAGELQMPPGRAPLPPGEVEILRRWIAAGAGWDAAGGGTEAGWWSFRKLRRPAVPEVRQRAWVRNPIDAFLLAGIEKKGLRLAPAADRRTLIRRAYFDLTGLPPAPERVEAFVNDPSPDAYRNLVEELLASPRYGERWARHWLDVVRYADSGGFETDLYLRHSWRYRDYVIQSFHQDKPYDRFVQEQIAADEIWPDDLALEGSHDLAPEKIEHLEARLGTAMYTFGAEEGESNMQIRKIRHEKLTDWVDTTGAAFLGLTVGCARCHDHKFDPFPQRDYYRLQAIFAATVEQEIPVVNKMQIRARDLSYWRILRLVELRTAHELLEKKARARALPAVRAKFSSEMRAAYDKDAGQRTPREKELAAPVEDAVQSLRPEKEMTPEELAEKQNLVAEIARIVLEAPKQAGDRPVPFDGLLDIPSAFVLGHADPSLVRPVRILGRGELAHPGERVLPGLPAALSEDRELEQDCTGRCVPAWRKQLALWLTEPDHPLTARVMVNRIWLWHFGAGIVATPNDFGRMGAQPVAPELLDWLASEFVARGWSIKAMHRLILLSNAYQMSSRFADPVNTRTDPHNRYLWRMNRRRLEAEAIWDSMHAVAGALNLKAGGRPVVVPLAEDELTALRAKEYWMPSLDPAEHRRRGIYILVRRNFRFPMFETFDGPDTTASCPERGVTTVAPQALWLMNNSAAVARARDLAARVAKEAGADPSAQIDRVWRLTLQRDPSPEEKKDAAELLSKMDGAALEKLCLAVYNLSEFAFVD